MKTDAGEWRKHPELPHREASHAIWFLHHDHIDIDRYIDSNPNSILARFDLSRAPADQDLLQYKVFEEEAEFEESDTERVTGAEHCASDSSSDESVDDAIGDGPTADAKATHV